jgi:hypothetical protein
MVRPPFGSPEWLANFEEVVRTSKTTQEAVDRLGYATPSVVYYHLKKFGIERPRLWNERPLLREFAQRNIPDVIIPTTIARRWVAGLAQGESCVQSIYREYANMTYLQLDTAMVDSGPIFKISEYYGLPPPTAPIRNHDWRPQWRKNVSGLRALRVLKEITPFLLGEKLKEAQKALEFFGPYGAHRGCFRNGDIWPRSEFPLRTKRRGTSFLMSSAAYLGRETNLEPEFTQASQSRLYRLKIPEIIILAPEDRSWVGGLIQGEGSILTHYVKSNDSTALVIMVSMTDEAPILRFSDLLGLPRPLKPKPAYRREQMPKWWRETTGLRALRVLREIQPYLVGEKLREADKALALFGSRGYRRGCFRASDVWPQNEFPLRNHNSAGWLL